MAALLALSLLAACSDDKGTDSPSGGVDTTTRTDGTDSDQGSATTLALPKRPNQLTIVAREYAFDVTGTLKAGWATIVLANRGKEEHVASFVPLKPGAAIAQVKSALSAGKFEDFLNLVVAADVAVGTPTIVGPGRTTTTVSQLLKAGTYAVIDVVPTPDGQPHFGKGMVAEVKVAGVDTTTTPPAANGTITLREGRIEGPTKLPSGRTTFKVDNAGTGDHELLVLRLDGDRTVEDVYAFFRAKLASGEPPPGDSSPGDVVGGAAKFPPKQSVYVTVDLLPGRYAFVCGTQGEGETTTHFEKGEKLGFTVE